MPSPNHTPIHRSIAALAIASGALMLIYLLLRPYGDAGGGETSAAAEAFASPLWIWSHLAGTAALVTLAALWSLISTGPVRWSAVAGVALVLPYYGAETFTLHAIGVRAETEPGVLPLVPEVRENPVAMTLFGIGLVALAVAGIAAALRWRQTQNRASGRTRTGTVFLPLAVMAALFLPQFFLPPAGRIAYGLLFSAAAAYAAYVLATSTAESADMNPPSSESADRAIP